MHPNWSKGLDHRQDRNWDQFSLNTDFFTKAGSNHGLMWHSDVRISLEDITRTKAFGLICICRSGDKGIAKEFIHHNGYTINGNYVHIFTYFAENRKLDFGYQFVASPYLHCAYMQCMVVESTAYSIKASPTSLVQYVKKRICQRDPSSSHSIHPHHHPQSHCSNPHTSLLTKTSPTAHPSPSQTAPSPHLPTPSEYYSTHPLQQPDSSSDDLFPPIKPLKN